jgi:truncated hemoglobin YjbI
MTKSEPAKGKAPEPAAPEPAAPEFIAPSGDAGSDFELLGGEPGLLAILRDFLQRVRGDVMIGYHFRNVDFARLLTLEFEFSREHLGGPGPYSGRPLFAAHAPHRILGGHFDRRLRLLEQTLEDHRVPAAVIERWLAHNRNLRAHITRDEEATCHD